MAGSAFFKGNSPNGSIYIELMVVCEALNAKNILRKASMQVRNDSMRLCKRALHPCNKNLPKKPVKTSVQKPILENQEV